ncbi:peptidylprolyl isomerase [Anditalea andensis]|uniref:peptidylprolyl isomerase n=1 Tax=Anditalea andensis TaxID=1048983 RepID=UPI000B084D68|nr:peptidylprolyl isomerase [Anditalea andensis]
MQPVGLIETPLGNIYILFHEQTPNHRKSFIQLAEAGYWDSLTFNRVIPNFVAQGGCPDTEEGFNDPEYLLSPELDSDLTHIYGAVGAGRDENPGKVSATCQFYIVQNPKGLHRLDGDYTIFGQVIRGMDVIDQIVGIPTSAENTPIRPISMIVKILQMEEKEIDKLKAVDKII